MMAGAMIIPTNATNTEEKAATAAIRTTNAKSMAVRIAAGVMMVAATAEVRTMTSAASMVRRTATNAIMTNAANTVKRNAVNATTKRKNTKPFAYHLVLLPHTSHMATN